MKNTLSYDNRIDIDMSLQALTTEVSHLEKLARKMDTVDRLILQDCSSRINQLMISKLSDPILSVSLA